MSEPNEIAKLKAELYDAKLEIAELKHALFSPQIENTYNLTGAQLALYNVLSSGRVVTRDILIHAMYGQIGRKEPDTETVNVHISHLRKKLKPHGYTIKAVYGEGYHMTRVTNGNTHSVGNGKESTPETVPEEIQGEK